jgi:hypothetical protein
MIFHIKNRKMNMQNLDLFLNFNDFGTPELPELKSCFHLNYTVSPIPIRTLRTIIVCVNIIENGVYK